MANLFDSSNFPPVEPEVLVIGDFWRWKRDDLKTDYPVASYALSYNARLQGTGSTTFAITASEGSDTYSVEVGSSTTGSYTAGTYEWSAFITRSSDSQRIQIDAGIWTIEENRASSSADPRSHAKKMLDKLEATLEDLATRLTSSYSIADRSNTLRRMEEVSQMRDKYLGIYRREIRKQRALNGQPNGQHQLTRFSPVKSSFTLSISDVT